MSSIKEVFLLKYLCLVSQSTWQMKHLNKFNEESSLIITLWEHWAGWLNKLEFQVCVWLPEKNKIIWIKNKYSFAFVLLLFFSSEKACTKIRSLPNTVNTYVPVHELHLWFTRSITHLYDIVICVSVWMTAKSSLTHFFTCTHTNALLDSWLNLFMENWPGSLSVFTGKTFRLNRFQLCRELGILCKMLISV